MNIRLTKNEKYVMNKINKEKHQYKSSIITQIISLITGGILILAPIIFLLFNFKEADQIIRRAGIYIGIMIVIGIMFCFYYTFLKIQDRTKKERAVLYSIIKKIVASGLIEIN